MSESILMIPIALATILFFKGIVSSIWGIFKTLVLFTAVAAVVFL